MVAHMFNLFFNGGLVNGHKIFGEHFLIVLTIWLLVSESGAFHD